MSSSFQPDAGSDLLSTDQHHEILSVSQKQTHNLLNHLEVRMPSAVESLLGQNTQVHPTILNHVELQLAPAHPAPPKKVKLGEEAPLSKCLLWKMQEDYYINLKIKAWEDGVPNFITSSIYIAEAYAELVIAFLDDYLPHLDVNEPVYVLELATGTGRFSFLMLRELERKLACFSKFKDIQLKYVMTDFTDCNPIYWEQHPKFTPFVEKGLLDFGVYNPLVSNTIELRRSGQVMSAETIKNPVIAIANYFFDSIPQDTFRVESKTLKEGLVTLERDLEKAENPDAPPHISEISTHYRYRDLPNTAYYADPKLNAILNHYRHNIKSGTVLFPVGAFDVVRNLQSMANNQVVLISSDKSYTSHSDMIRFYQHEFAIHSGAFSYMVNYDAIGHYFENEQGHFFRTTSRNLSINTVCCIAVKHTQCPFENLSYQFSEKLNRNNLINSLCGAFPNRDMTDPVMRMNYLLSMLRLHNAEPRITFNLAEDLLAAIDGSLPEQQQELLKLIGLAIEQFYFSPGESNLTFWLSQIYHKLDHFQESLKCLDITIENFGVHEVLFYLKGQNYERLQQWADAKEEYEKALALKSDFPEALASLSLVEERLN